jgi:uncharacterized protein
MTKQMWNHDH